MTEKGNECEISVRVRRSEVLDFEWTGDRVSYEGKEKGDCFPITWSDDDHLYTSCGDPNWTAFKDKLNIYNAVPEGGGTPFAYSGLDFERITGFPPRHNVEKVNDMLHFVGWGDKGPKPTGVISVKGILYLAVTDIGGARLPRMDGRKAFVGVDGCIICSKDKGKTWSSDGLTPEELPKRIKPIFPGNKFGGPAFVQFGKDNADAPDKYVYAISTTVWDNGDDLFIGRVSSDSIMHQDEWQWITEFREDKSPVWKGNLEEARSVLSLRGSISSPEMVYLKRLNRYLLLTFRTHTDGNPYGSDLLIFESPSVWGPYSLVYFESPWEKKEIGPYTPRLPLKWFDLKTNTGWLLHSGTWDTPDKEYYRANVRPFRLLVKENADVG